MPLELHRPRPPDCSAAAQVAGVPAVRGHPALARPVDRSTARSRIWCGLRPAHRFVSAPSSPRDGCRVTRSRLSGESVHCPAPCTVRTWTYTRHVRPWPARTGHPLAVGSMVVPAPSPSASEQRPPGGALPICGWVPRDRRCTRAWRRSRRCAPAFRASRCATVPGCRQPPGSGGAPTRCSSGRTTPNTSPCGRSREARGNTYESCGPP